MKLFTLYLLPVFFCLYLTAFAQLDSRVVGNWVSSSGANIKIDYPNEDNTNLVLISINGGAPIRATLEGGDMDSVIMTYRLSNGSVMTGYLNPMTKEISLYEKDTEYSTWKRR